jgi:hypothetical protein
MSRSKTLARSASNANLLSIFESLIQNLCVTCVGSCKHSKVTADSATVIGTLFRFDILVYQNSTFVMLKPYIQ